MCIKLIQFWTKGEDITKRRTKKSWKLEFGSSKWLFEIKKIVHPNQSTIPKTHTATPTYHHKHHTFHVSPFTKRILYIPIQPDLNQVHRNPFKPHINPFSITNLYNLYTHTKKPYKLKYKLIRLYATNINFDHIRSNDMLLYSS